MSVPEAERLYTPLERVSEALRYPHRPSESPARLRPRAVSSVALLFERRYLPIVHDALPGSRPSPWPLAARSSSFEEIPTTLPPEYLSWFVSPLMMARWPRLQKPSQPRPLSPSGECYSVSLYLCKYVCMLVDTDRTLTEWWGDPSSIRRQPHSAERWSAPSALRWAWMPT